MHNKPIPNFHIQSLQRRCQTVSSTKVLHPHGRFSLSKGSSRIFGILKQKRRRIQKIPAMANMDQVLKQRRPLLTGQF